MIGAELIENFQPVLLLFAGVLLYSAYGLLAKKEEEDDSDLSDNQIVKVCRYQADSSAVRAPMFVSCIASSQKEPPQTFPQPPLDVPFTSVNWLLFD